MAPIKTVRKLGIVIPSRRSLAARLWLHFFLGDQSCPSWIGGQKWNARCDVNCDDWTDRRLSSSAGVTAYAELTFLISHLVRVNQRSICRNGGALMESATFRKWLADRGCRFDHHEHQQRGKGQMMVTVHREGRKVEVPLGGSRKILDQRVVHRACQELGLDPSQLPGAQSRV